MERFAHAIRIRLHVVIPAIRKRVVTDVAAPVADGIGLSLSRSFPARQTFFIHLRGALVLWAASLLQSLNRLEAPSGLRSA